VVTDVLKERDVFTIKSHKHLRTYNFHSMHNDTPVIIQNKKRVKIVLCKCAFSYDGPVRLKTRGNLCIFNHYRNYNGVFAFRLFTH